MCACLCASGRTVAHDYRWAQAALVLPQRQSKEQHSLAMTLPPKRSKRTAATVDSIIGRSCQQFLSFWTEEASDNILLIAWVSGHANCHTKLEQRVISLKREDKEDAKTIMDSVSALNDLLAQVMSTQEKRGRLLCWDLQHQGAAIDKALQAFGLRALLPTWHNALDFAIDLQQDAIKIWLIETHGIQHDAKLSQLDVLEALYTAKLAPTTQPSERALVNMDILHGLHLLATPPCQLHGMCEYTKVYPSGHRDNNEYELLCEQCGHSF